MKIAVIGSGIAGLSASWYLRQKHEVTLYERWPTLGMDAHTAEIDCDGEALFINVPMRVFFPEYYPTLTSLYQELGVKFEPVQYSGSFSHFGGKTFFRYKNYWLGPLTVPFLAGRSLRSPAAMKIGRELVQLISKANKADRKYSLDSICIEEYLAREGYSQLFADQFVYPTFAGICTCSYDSVKAYPASIILDYLRSGLTWSKVNRLTHGTGDAATRLADSASETFFNMQLQAITPTANGVEVTDGNGHTATYDHVVMATQANQALSLLPAATAAEKSALGSFEYERSHIVVHKDERLAPANPAEWAPVNFLLSEHHDKPMASIVMNRIHPQLKGKPSVFETWNPFVPATASDVLLEAEFERPVVTMNSLQGIKKLENLHQEPDRRIWFCGSYSRRGIPLLESATASANDVAQRLNSMEAASQD